MRLLWMVILLSVVLAINMQADRSCGLKRLIISNCSHVFGVQNYGTTMEIEIEPFLQEQTYY